MTPDTDAHKTNVVTRVTPENGLRRIEINEAFVAIVVALSANMAFPRTSSILKVA